jgi:hypothetical protein
MKLLALKTILFLSLVFPATTAADSIDPAIDLFHVIPGSNSFINANVSLLPSGSGTASIPLRGGGLSGLAPGTNADVIVDRLSGLPSGATGAIPTEMVALSLVSINPIQVGGKDWNVQVLFDAHNFGVVDIKTHPEPNGTFDSLFNFDYRIIFSEDGNPTNVFFDIVPLQVQSSSDPWTHVAPFGAPAGRDFYIAPFIVTQSSGDDFGLELEMAVPIIPEPGSFALMFIGGAALIGMRIRRKRN